MARLLKHNTELLRQKMLQAYRVRGNTTLQFNQLQTGSLKHRALILKNLNKLMYNAANFLWPEFLLASQRD